MPPANSLTDAIGNNGGGLTIARGMGDHAYIPTVPEFRPITNGDVVKPINLLANTSSVSVSDVGRFLFGAPHNQNPSFCISSTSGTWCLFIVSGLGSSVAFFLIRTVYVYKQTDVWKEETKSRTIESPIDYLFKPVLGLPMVLILWPVVKWLRGRRPSNVTDSNEAASNDGISNAKLLSSRNYSLLRIYCRSVALIPKYSVR